MGDLNKTVKGADKAHANADDISVYEVEGPVFHELPSWKKNVRVSIKQMYKHFKHWGKSQGQKSAEHRTLKDFKNNITHVLSLGLKVQPLTMSNDDVVTFEPVRLYYTMYQSYMMSPAEAVIDELRTWREAERAALESTQPVLTSADSDSETDEEDEPDYLAECME